MSQLASTSHGPPPEPAVDPELQVWKERFKEAERARKPFERDWQIAKSFLEGKQWIGWDTSGKRVVDLPNPQKRVRYTVNMLTGYMDRFQGKLLADDIRPDVTFRRSDVTGKAQDFADASRRALEYGWDEEAKAEQAFEIASEKRLTYGMGFIRVRYDPLHGAEQGTFPVADGSPLTLTSAGPDGQPQRQEIPTRPGQVLTDPDHATAYVEQAFASGEPVEWRKLREGKVCMEPGGPFEFYPPPGLEHESLFPWLIIARAVPVELVKALYKKAANLTAETLRVVDTVGLSSQDGSSVHRGVLKGHVMLYTGYDLKNPEKPQGAQVIWARDTLLEQREELPFQIKGEGKAGVAVLKFRTITGRFWPIGLIEPGVGAQRQVNHSRSQNQEVKDRIGMPRVWATENSITEVNRPKGMIAEVINVRPGFELPKESQGVGPGPWIQNEAELCKADLDTVMGLRSDPAQAPPGTTAYSAFAFFNEQEDQAIGPIRKRDREQLKCLAEFVLDSIRLYWPHEKLIAVEGEDGLRDEIAFSAGELPTEFYIKLAESAPAPQNTAAQLQLVMDLFDRSISSGQPLTLDWLYNSIKAGKPLPLPKQEPMLQTELARFENLLMSKGEQVQVQPWHNDQLHIAEHDQATFTYEGIPGFEPVLQLILMHKQVHMEQMQAKAAQVPPTNNGQVAEPGAGIGGQNAGLGPAAAAQAAQGQQQQ